jgi:hypothetical protein
MTDAQRAVDATPAPLDMMVAANTLDAAKALINAQIEAKFPAPLDSTHPDCGYQCHCYRRGRNDEWEATHD